MLLTNCTQEAERGGITNLRTEDLFFPDAQSARLASMHIMQNDAAILEKATEIYPEHGFTSWDIKILAIHDEDGSISVNFSYQHWPEENKQRNDALAQAYLDFLKQTYGDYLR